MLPEFLIIGAQKSGTTFIHRCLEDHPDIYMPHKEIPFFENPDYLRNDISELENLFENISSESVIGIKRPNYLGKKEVAKRIYKHMPNAKLILCLRNPLERTISSYFHQMAHGFIPVEPINYGLKKILNGDYKERFPRSREIIEFSLYYKHLKNYLKYFNRSQIKIIFFEEMKEKNLETIQSIYKYIGVNSNFIPKKYNSKQNVNVYSYKRLKVRTLVNNLMYDYNKNNTRQYKKKDISLRNKLIIAFIILFDTKLLKYLFNNKKPKLDKVIKEDLYNTYKQDIKKLEKLLSVNLENWKYKFIDKK